MFSSRLIKQILNLREQYLQHSKEETSADNSEKFRYFSDSCRDEFYSKGYKKRHFFPHRVYYLPKCGPDGYKLAYRMCGAKDPNQMWELILYALPPLLNEFPNHLFFDDDLIWHQQQFGKIGQIATVDMTIKDYTLYTMAHLSDIVQRISRFREYKTRIEKVFQGWYHLLLNSIMVFAVEKKLKYVCMPTASWAMKNTDQKRTVQKELFERIYDRAVHHHFQVHQQGKWWKIDVSANLDRVIMPEKGTEAIPEIKTICLCHDIEKGLGHLDVDTYLANLANQNYFANLREMLEIEREFKIKATYNVVGIILEELREIIEQYGHCLAFHSYDHSFLTKNQLGLCRSIDYRLKGYRPPQSKITKEINDNNLCFQNFEWFASSAYSLKIDIPKLENRTVKIPTHFDEFDLYKKRINYAEWELRAIERINNNQFVAFSLHDCYAQFWLPHYRSFLAKIRELGDFQTLDEVASEVIFKNAY